MAIDVRGLAPLLQVFDMPTAVKFYRDVLGFELISTSGRGPNFGWVLLKLHGLELMLSAAYDDARPPQPDPTRVAAHGDTAIVFGCPDVDAVYARVRAHGVKADEPKIAPWGFKTLSITDPDGYILSFHWPATATTIQQWREWYGFDPEAVQPRGGRCG